MPNAEIPRVPRDVSCYFDNTDKLHALAKARRLMQMLDVGGRPLFQRSKRCTRAKT